MAQIKLTDSFSQIVNGLSVGKLMITDNTYATPAMSAAGWQNIASFKCEIGNSQNWPPLGIFFIGGFYNAYNPTKAVVAFAGNRGGSSSLVNLACALGTSPTKIRIRQNAAVWYIDLYRSDTRAMNFQRFSSILSSITDFTFLDTPESVPETPTDGSTVRATLTFKAIASGSVTTTA